MKKSLTILTIAILAIMTFAGFVNAGSVSAPAEVKQGQEVTVTVSVDTAVTTAEFKVNYDPAKYEFVSFPEGSTSVASAANGVVTYTYMGTATNTMKVTFKALTNATVGNSEFSVTDTEFTSPTQVAPTGETLTPAAATVAIVAPTTGETTDPNPDETQTPDPEGENQKGENPPMGTDGKPVNEIPNAGTPIFVGAIALIVISGAVLVIKNRK